MTEPHSDFELYEHGNVCTDPIDAYAYHDTSDEESTIIYQDDPQVTFQFPNVFFEL